MISVSGMRGIVGKDLTPELVARYAAALGAWARHAGKSLVVLGRDSRTSGAMFTRAASAGLLSVGVDVMDLGLVPTPTVQLAVEHHRAGAGLVLTASHNPVEWNALKFIGPDGVFLDGAAGEVVRALAERGPPRQGWDGIGAVLEDREALARHLELILRLPVLDAAAIRARGFHVALDCVRGAGATIMPALLEALGCRITAINLETDGHFPRPPEPVPENLAELSRLVKESGADVGFAVDPDVDRLAIVDDRGEPIGEDYTLALAVRGVLGPPAGTQAERRVEPVGDRRARRGDRRHSSDDRRMSEHAELGGDPERRRTDKGDRRATRDRRARGRDDRRVAGPAITPATAGGQPVVVANLSTSLVVEDAAKAHGARFLRAPVGEANVARMIQAERAVIGGEGNGGVIFPALHVGRDAPLAAALVLQLLVREGKPLSALVAGWPRYYIVKAKSPRGPEPSSAYARLRKRFPEADADTRDGLRLAWPDRWVHLRPSGTEPIVRFIAEAPTEAEASALVAACRDDFTGGR